MINWFCHYWLHVINPWISSSTIWKFNYENCPTIRSTPPAASAIILFQMLVLWYKLSESNATHLQNICRMMRSRFPSTYMPMPRQASTEDAQCCSDCRSSGSADLVYKLPSRRVSLRLSQHHKLSFSKKITNYLTNYTELSTWATNFTEHVKQFLDSFFIYPQRISSTKLADKKLIL